MITKNTNGTNLSSGFISQIQSDSPEVIARLWYNNAELSCDIVDITVEKGSCGEQTFMVGNVIGDMLTATVKGLSADIKGELIECHIGALVSGSYEYVSLGRFRVSEVKKTRYEAIITAYSSVVADTGTRLDVTGLSNPTIAQIASKIAGKLGCTVTFDTGIDTSLRVNAQFDGLTYYQALQIIAICCGGFVVNTYDGNVRVHKFSTTSTLSVNTGMMVKLPEIAEQPYVVDSVGVMVSEATTDNEGNDVAEIFYSDNPAYIVVTKQGTNYYLKAENGKFIVANLKPESADVYFSCPYMTEQIFSTNVKGIKGYTYSPATIGLTLGDPRLEGCDVLDVTDVDGSTYVVPCHKIVHKYTGGFTSEIKSCDASDNANSIGTSFPITQRFETQARQIGTAQATADNAYKIAGDTNQYFWFTGSGSDTGAHITETPQDQFIADPQNGGGNLLARSNGVAIRDGLTELATFGAYGANINENGVSIANFGSTARVGAEDSSRFLMNAGSLEAYDNENSKYFEVSPDGMTFGDNSVASQQYVDDAEQDAIDTASADATSKANTAEANAIATASADATEKANEAKKTATNYMYFNASTGLNIASADPATATRKVNISADGIKLQNDANNYALVSSSGLDVHKGGSSVANFGTTARLGVDGSSRFLMNASSLQAYSSNQKYFEVSASGMTYGTHTVADQDYADGVASTAQANAEATASADATAKANEAKKVATNYMYFNSSTGLDIASANPSTATRKVNISADGVKIQEDANNYAVVEADGMDIYQNGNSVAQFGNTARVGAESGYKTIVSGQGFVWSRSVAELFKLGLTNVKVAVSGKTLRFTPSSVNVEHTFSWIESLPEGTTVTITCGGNDASIVTGTSSSNSYLSYDGDCTITTKTTNQYAISQPSYSYSPPFMVFGQPIGVDEDYSYGAYSASLGSHAVATGNSQTAVGKYNYLDTTPLFVVGNGNSNLRSNALAVDPNGNLRIKGNLYTNCDADSSNGTLVTMLKVTKSSVSSLSTTITNSAITADMEVVHTVLSNPSAQTGDWTVTTSNGSLTIVGSISGTTNITLYLAVPRT